MIYVSMPANPFMLLCTDWQRRELMDDVRYKLFWSRSTSLLGSNARGAMMVTDTIAK